MDTTQFVRGINNKDIVAWEELYAKYYASLCSYCNGILHNRDAAQDIAQEVLIAVWKSSKKFENPRDLSLYFYRACYNNALIYLRNTNLRKGLIENMEVERHEDPDKIFAMSVREELIRQLYLHINELPAGSREIMELSIHGLSGPEIADKLGISINTVKTQKSRGFKFLREKLKDSLLVFLI